MPIGVSYDSDLEKVERITLEIAREIMNEIPGGIPGYEPVLRYNSFADSSINFNVIMRAADFSNQFILKHEFIKRLHARYDKENIQIPFPVRTVYIKEEK